MPIATSPIRAIEGANAAATAAAKPFDPTTYRASRTLAIEPQRNAGFIVSVFVILNEAATAILHETTDINAHNSRKLLLRCMGTIFHHGCASGTTKFEARAKIANAMKVLAAKIENE